MEKAQGKLNYLLVFFIPFVPMLYQYSNNSTEVYILHVLFVSLVFGMFSLAGYLLVGKLAKSAFAGIVFCVVGWVFFFAYGAFHAAVSLRHMYSLLIIIAIVICITIFAGKIDKKNNLRSIYPFITIVIAILLVWNGIVAFASIPKAKGYSIPYKTEFTIDEALPSPNIYWIHTDGMLSFYAVEKYFGDAQEEFASALEERGFVINKEAKFEAAHKTRMALPVLLSPACYDDYLYNLLLVQQEKSAIKPDTYVDEIANSSVLLEIRENSELIKAFEQSGYYSASVSVVNHGLPPITDYYVNMGRKKKPVLITDREKKGIISKREEMHDQGTNLRELLDQISMTSAVSDALANSIMDKLFQGNEEVAWRAFETKINPDDYIPSTETRSRERVPLMAMDEILSLPSPRIAFIVMLTAHHDFVLDENGISHKYDRDYAQNYYPQHRFATKYLINYIDFILERDPDAVIILQGDHGLHSMSSENLMNDLSISEDEVVDLWNCVMSAVRIPEKYGTLDEPLNPVNITRYLVNHYVGENYEYRLPEDSQGLY